MCSFGGAGGAGLAIRLAKIETNKHRHLFGLIPHTLSSEHNNPVTALIAGGDTDRNSPFCSTLTSSSTNWSRHRSLMPSPDPTLLETSHPLSPPPAPEQPAQQTPLKIKIMPVLTRNRAKSDSIGPSGSEYNASEASAPGQEIDADAESDQPVSYTTSQRGRRVKQVVYEESDDEIDGIGDQAKNLFDANVEVTYHQSNDVNNEDEDTGPRRRLTRQSIRNLPDFVIEDEEEKHEDSAGYSLRRRTRSATAPPKKNTNLIPKKPSREDRYQARLRRLEHREEDDQYVDHSDPSSADADGSVDENVDVMSTSDLEVTLEPEPEPEPEPDVDNDGKPYSLRQRQKINYAIPPPLEEMVRPPPKVNGNRNGGRGVLPKGRRGPGWSAGGAELGRWMGMGGGDDSVCFLQNLLFTSILNSGRTPITPREHLANNLLVQ